MSSQSWNASEYAALKLQQQVVALRKQQRISDVLLLLFSNVRLD